MLYKYARFLHMRAPTTRRQTEPHAVAEALVAALLLFVLLLSARMIGRSVSHYRAKYLGFDFEILHQRQSRVHPRPTPQPHTSIVVIIVLVAATCDHWRIHHCTVAQPQLQSQPEQYNTGTAPHQASQCSVQRCTAQYGTQ